MASKRTSIFMVLSSTNRTSNKYDCDSSDNKEELEGRVQISENNSKTPNIVGDIMWPVIWFLKLFGHSPLSYVGRIKHKSDLKSKIEPRSEKESGVGGFLVREYKIQFKSLSFLWTTFSALWILFSLGFSIFEIFHSNQTGLFTLIQKTVENMAQRGSISGDVVRVIKVVSCSVVTVQVLDLILSWTESSSLGKFLNSSAPLQQEFQLNFPYLTLMGGRYKKLKRTRNALFIFYIALPACGFLIVQLYAVGTSHLFSLVTVALPFAWHSSAVALMEDVKIIMTYRILAESFGQIREGMTHSLEWEKLSLGRVRCWKRLVQMVRLQVVQAGQTQKSHELFLLGGSIVLTTGLVFIFIRIPWTAPGSGLLRCLISGFIAYLVGRLYLKVLASKSITSEEGAIANQLVTINTTDDDVHIEMEIKFLHDMITQNPSVISFGSYVNLNKGLILGISSQIVTYIIVLMQFTQT